MDGELDIGVECSSAADFSGKTRRILLGQNDSSSLPIADAEVDFVVTDPPYFDSVQYSDLSHFFRCWLRQFLPGIPINWMYDVSTSAVAETVVEDKKFGNTMECIWKECSRTLKRPHGRLIFTYHHWRADAWIQLTKELLGASFRLANAFVIHSENPISVHIRHLKALKHD